MNAFIRYTSLVLVSVASISTAWMGASISSTGYSAEPICNSSLEYALASRATQEKQSMSLSCTLVKQRENPVKSLFEQPKSNSLSEATASTTRAKLSDSKPDNFYPAYCPTVSSRLNPEDFLFRQTLERCKYGH